MIKVLVGLKGSGKTAYLVEEMNDHALNSELNVVCIERGRRLDTQIKPQIRLINIDEYPVEGYEQVQGFVAGICSKDYDITDIYIDSMKKVARSEDNDRFLNFLENIEPLILDRNINLVILYSADPNRIPEGLKKYIEEF